MRKEYSDLDKLIKNELSKKEEKSTSKLIKKLNRVKKEDILLDRNLSRSECGKAHVPKDYI